MGLMRPKDRRSPVACARDPLGEVTEASTDAWLMAPLSDEEDATFPWVRFIP